MVNYISSASVALVCYDHFLTIGSEIQLVWRRPMHIVSIMFIIARYFSLFMNIAWFLLLFFVISPAECDSLNLVHNFFVGICLSYILAVQLWRISALYNHNKKMLLWILPPFSGCLGVIIVRRTIFHCSSIVYNWFGRQWYLNSNTGSNIGFSRGYCYDAVQLSNGDLKLIWIVFLVWDIIMIFLTAQRTWKTARGSQGILRGNHSSTILLRDGVLFFLIVIIFHFANILVIFMNPHITIYDRLSWIGACIGVIMTSRHILNLRQSSYASILINSDDENDVGDMVMTDIVLQQLGERDEKEADWPNFSRSHPIHSHQAEPW